MGIFASLHKPSIELIMMRREAVLNSIKAKKPGKPYTMQLLEARKSSYKKNTYFPQSKEENFKNQTYENISEEPVKVEQHRKNTLLRRLSARRKSRRKVVRIVSRPTRVIEVPSLESLVDSNKESKNQTEHPAVKDSTTSSTTTNQNLKGDAMNIYAMTSLRVNTVSAGTQTYFTEPTDSIKKEVCQVENLTPKTSLSSTSNYRESFKFSSSGPLPISPRKTVSDVFSDTNQSSVTDLNLSYSDEPSLSDFRSIGNIKKKIEWKPTSLEGKMRVKSVPTTLFSRDTEQSHSTRNWVSYDNSREIYNSFREEMEEKELSLLDYTEPETYFVPHRPIRKEKSYQENRRYRFGDNDFIVRLPVLYNLII